MKKNKSVMDEYHEVVLERFCKFDKVKFDQMMKEAYEKAKEFNEKLYAKYHTLRHNNP